MSIIIQTGHSSSHSNTLMNMLYERGLGSPINSHTHGFSAHEITEKLAKVLNKNSSIINTKIIDNLIVDLLLANLDQDDWGWADENNLSTLPYWQQMDDNVRFILIFDSPKLLLKKLLGTQITQESVHQALSDWLNYNQQLLEFFETSATNCLLVEGDLIINNLSNVKEHIQALTTNLKLKSNWQLQDVSTPHSDDTNPMFEIVATEILKQYPDCLALYDLLIEKSTIRLKTKQLTNTSNLSSLIDSLNLFNEQEEIKKKTDNSE
ncbi:hypothetical protein [Moraxella oblonga]|uniref:hypothetical protein n=1 Tax=Moraxella oblonga TaxID=200413 RepID=UPI000835459C|nr:hypothetical protein [Moraxella oblonga]